MGLRFSREYKCGRCGSWNVLPTRWTRFTNLFKRPRIIRINKHGPTPGLFYPGEKVALLPHEPDCPENQPVDWEDVRRGGNKAMFANCNCDD